MIDLTESKIEYKNTIKNLLEKCFVKENLRKVNEEYEKDIILSKNNKKKKFEIKNFPEIVKEKRYCSITKQRNK